MAIASTAILGRDIDPVLENLSSFSTRASSRTSTLSPLRRSSSCSTLVSSSNSPMTSFPAQTTAQQNLSNFLPSSIAGIIEQDDKGVEMTRRYTRRIVGEVKPQPKAIKLVTAQMRDARNTAKELSQKKGASSVTSSQLPPSLPVIVPTVPCEHVRVSMQPRQRISASDLARRHLKKTIGAPRTPSHTPGFRDASFPVPDVIVTDFSLLASSTDRYASSPRCLAQIRPYHNIADVRFLHRYSASQSANLRGFQLPGLEVVDAQTFTEMGGQESVVVFKLNRVQQRKGAAIGCPSRACTCRGRGLAMCGCGDMKEDKEEDDVVAVGSRIRVGRIRKMSSRDQIEEARRMRARIEERRKTREASSKEQSDGEESLVRLVRDVGVSNGLGRIKTVRRRKSRFTEVGCTLGNDSAETLCSAAGAPENVQKAAPKATAGSGIGDAREKQKDSRPAKNRKRRWIRTILRI